MPSFAPSLLRPSRDRCLELGSIRFLLLASTFFVLPASAAHAQTDSLSEARRHFEQGVAFADAGNCEAAVGEFEESLVHAQRANTLYNLGQCLERLMRLDEALVAYEQYLRIAGEYDPARTEVESAATALERVLGEIIVDTVPDSPAEVWIDQRRQYSSRTPIRLGPGMHRIEIRARGYQPTIREITIASGRRAAITIHLQEVSRTVVNADEGLPRWVFWAGVGATAATALAGSALGIYALRVRDDATQDDPRLSNDDEIRAIDRASLTADILFGTSAVLAAGTLTLFFLTDWDGGERRRQTASFRLEPRWSTSHFGVEVGGEF